jgi:hypothetical protein
MFQSFSHRGAGSFDHAPQRVVQEQAHKAPPKMHAALIKPIVRELIMRLCRLFFCSSHQLANRVGAIRDLQSRLNLSRLQPNKTIFPQGDGMGPRSHMTREPFFATLHARHEPDGNGVAKSLQKTLRL